MILELQVIFKPIIILSLLYLYSITKHKRQILYELGLLLALASNIFLLDRSDGILLNLGVFTTVLYILFYLIIVMRNSRGKNFLVVLLCSLPLMAIAGYEISLFSENLGNNFWAIIFGGSIISLFCGLAFYSYFLVKSQKHVYLLVSGLCLFFVAILFSLEVFYFNFQILRVATLGTFALFQYAFYLYAIEKEDNVERLFDESIV